MMNINLEEDFARKMGICYCCGSHYGIAAKPPLTEWASMIIFWTCFDCEDDCKQPPCPKYKTHDHECEDDPDCPIHNGSLDDEIERHINLFLDFLQKVLKKHQIIELGVKHDPVITHTCNTLTKLGYTMFPCRALGKDAAFLVFDRTVPKEEITRIRDDPRIVAFNEELVQAKQVLSTKEVTPQ